MLTFKAEVLKSKQKSDGTYNVKIRMTYNREVKRLATNIFVRQEDLTKSFKLKNPKFIQEADAIVRHYQEMCAKLQVDINNYTMDEIIALLKGEQMKSQEIDFIQFSREWIAHATIKGAENYTSAINAFVQFLEKDKLIIQQLTTSLLKDFMDYLVRKREEKMKLLKKQGKRIPSNRVVSLYLGSIRHLFNEAKRQYNDYDRDIILISHSPFENFKIPKQEATRKRAMTRRTMPITISKTVIYVSSDFMMSAPSRPFFCAEISDGGAIRCVVLIIPYRTPACQYFLAVFLRKSVK